MLLLSFQSTIDITIINNEFYIRNRPLISVMPLRSSFPVNVDDDDDINNTKPAATERNDVSLVCDGTVNSTPSATFTNVAPVTLSPNDVVVDVDASNQSLSSW